MNANVQYLRRLPEVRFARLAGFTVDVPANRLQRGEQETRLTPKAMAVLREMLQRPGVVVRRDDLLGIVWRDGFPTDDVLTHAVTELRRALEDDPRAPRIIETIPKVGYRLLGQVEVLAEAPLAEAELEPVAPAPEGATAQQRPWLLIGVLAMLLALTLGIPVARKIAQARAQETAAPVGPATIRPVALTSDPEREAFPTLSPDGATVAFVQWSQVLGRSRLLLKSTDPAGTVVVLTDPPVGVMDEYPTWSPDGKQLAFLRMQRESCEILIMPALGGPARTISDCPTATLDYIDWTADGKGLLVTRRGWDKGPMASPSTVHRIDLATGEKRPIEYSPKGTGETDLQPKSSPDGRWIAFRRGAVPYSDLWIMPTEGGIARRLTSLRSRMRGFAWENDSANIVLSSDHEGEQTLYRVSSRDGAVSPLGGTGAYFPSIARRAPVLVYQQENMLTHVVRFDLDAQRQVVGKEIVAPATRSDSLPSLAPGGGRFAFVSLRDGTPQIWLHEFATGLSTPVTRLSGVEVGFPQWSPDDGALLFVARGSGKSVLYRVEIASGRLERLSREDERVRWGSYLKDGSGIVYSSDLGGTWQVWRMATDGSGNEVLGGQGGFDPRDFLGDGHVYYIKETSGGLQRLNLATREETCVSPWVGFGNMDSMRVVGEHVYFLSVGDERQTEIWLERAPLHAAGVRFASDQFAWVDNGDGSKVTMAEIERVARIDAGPLGTQASISADLKRIVGLTIARDDTDLMTATLPVAR